MRIPFDKVEHEEFTDAKFEGKPFTGTAFEIRHGILVEECDFVNGQRHGVRREFNSDGGLKEIAHYVDGREHGICQSFFANGQLRHSAMYDHGTLKHEVLYGEGGEKIDEYTAESGIRTEWRLDGSLRKITVYALDTAPYHAPREERYYDEHGKPTITRGSTGWAVEGNSAG